MSTCRRPLVARFTLAAALAAVLASVLVALCAAWPGTASAASLGQLNSQLGAQQSRQQSLSASVGRLSSLISTLGSQISLVESREAAVRAELAHDQAALAAAHTALVREKARLKLLRARLRWARTLLSRQLVSSYETDRPDLVSVVLSARGFTDLLERLDFLHRAERQQQTVISLTRTAKAQATLAAHRLVKLERERRVISDETAVHARALAGMNALLQSRQSALDQARSAQQDALAASRAQAQHLRSQIARVKAAEAAAAARAAAQAAQSAPSTSGSGSGAGSPGPALGPNGGWAIPYAIVLCESGGQNLPPNSAGASGYYQIIPSTWSSFGGTGPAAYLASKAEQDAVATRIWNGGAGASNWVCAGIVGITH
jgi:septal ring factor EnvC (AmiA/AmiB activator)